MDNYIYKLRWKKFIDEFLKRNNYVVKIIEIANHYFEK